MFFGTNSSGAANRTRAEPAPRGAVVACTHKSGSVIDVRFTPDATKLLRSSEMTRCANRRHRPSYSITSSARTRSVGGTVRPSALAVVRLMMRSNLVGCATGMSAGFALAISCRCNRRLASAALKR